MLRRLLVSGLVCMLAVAAPLSSAVASEDAKTPVPQRPSGVLRPASLAVPAPLGASPVTGVLGVATLVGTMDAYSITLQRGDRLVASMTGAAGTDFEMYLAPADDPYAYFAGSYTWGTSDEMFEYTAWDSGDYLLVLEATNGSGSYSIDWSVGPGAATDYPPGQLITTTPQAGAFTPIGSGAHYYNLDLMAGTILDLSLTFDEGMDVEARLLSLGTEWLDFDYAAVADESDAKHERLRYRVPVTGRYTLAVLAGFEPEGTYTLSWTTNSMPAVGRIAGNDRIATAIAVSQRTFPDGAPMAIVATAYNWPDALGGAALAGAYDCPILLTKPTVLPAEVAAHIQALGAVDVIVLGGEGAVSADVFKALQAIPGVEGVERIDGATRYETATAIAQRVKAVGGQVTALVATGEDFPDALAASPIAARMAWPVYLVPPQTDRHVAMVEGMRVDGIDRVMVLGGTGAVPASFAFACADRMEWVRRLYGENRYVTAASIAEYAVSELAFEWDGFALATGEDFPDALAGGVMQGKAGAPLLLTVPGVLHGATGTALQSHKDLIAHGWALGGTGAVSESARLEAQSLLGLDI